MCNIEYREKKKEACIKWIVAHNFEYKVKGNMIYWLTNYQTMGYNIKTEKITCYNEKYFEKIS